MKRPAFISIGPRDLLFVMDSEDYSVKVMEATGHIVGSRSIPRTSLVRSFIPLTGMTVSADGTIWFCNPSGHVVGLPDRHDEPIVLPKAYKVAAFGARLLVMEGLGEENLFSLYDRQGIRIARFGVLLSDQTLNGIAIDGQIAADRDGRGMYFGPYYAGFFASYDAHGRLRYIRTTVDAPPLPTVRQVKGGVLASKPAKTAVQLSDLAAFGDHVYVLMDLPLQQGRQSVVDLYAARDGDYLYSFQLPERCSGIEVAHGVAFTACRDHIIAWSTAPPSRDTTDE